ncbi:adenylate/guanylate cyclase domain-containing protein [Novosphingobium sp. G106]|uniref:adenylate/guanylate cyclase domain-containing protein n=1 Tax=Novosphingobium sp. G106 TaxID=2849500 RepID=UPI001C2CF183|nr:adenylate/guanylate cyclase domain-containing protein [Novosphingobium sp. G106]MBV1689908.1 adenylate/guanylate cyclase domain-containing protein [Novosphingobium sp. G106]
MAETGPAAVVGYCGHMFNAGCAEEVPLAARIGEALDRLGTTIGYGPLACGADLLIAEALLARGAELNVVLPFAEEDFIPESVLCGGEGWLARYHACRDAAVAVHFATPGAYVGDDNQFAYNTRLVMGLTALRAQQIGSEAVQVAVISDKFQTLSKTGLAGTLADIGMWQALGRETVAIPAGPVERNLAFPQHAPAGDGTRREIRSVLFADYKGFSRLGERELPLFMAEVMGRIGAVLAEFGDHVEFRNTWGDAIYAIVDEPRIAARLALALQQRLADLPPALTPPGGIAGMRIGLHYGPIWVGTDRITGNRIWYGSEVNRTARIEPVTPVGGVYCTESFAAALLIDDCNDCRFTSVGRKALAKEAGELELYLLEAV